MEKLIQYLEENGYFDMRVIDGQLCGLHRYAYTTGIVVGLTELSYERRYCYPLHREAVAAFEAMTTVDKHPDGPWVKVKGRFKGELLDDLNPNLTV